MAIEMGADEFEGYVNEALDSIPDELIDLLDNCIIVIADDAPPEDPELLGLYEGIPLTERGVSYGGVLPDTISIFRNPTWRSATRSRTSSTRCTSPSCTRSRTSSASTTTDCTNSVTPDP